MNWPDLFALLSVVALLLPAIFWLVNIAGFVLHIPAVVIRGGPKEVSVMVSAHLRSVKMMFGRQMAFALRKRGWLPQPQYPDSGYDRTALTAGLPATHLRAARYGLSLVLPGVVFAAVFATLMALAHWLA
jgi:hypothetical protein